MTDNTESLIAIQLLDGVANAIFGVVLILVVADRTRAQAGSISFKAVSQWRSGLVQLSA